ncbi:hypothetical protein P5V15_003948 [Pogonomyrmex californicus]
MDAIKAGWFSEVNDLWPGVALSLEIEEVLHSERSQFQDILVVKTKSHGKALMLDGVIQCTEKDEMSYHEMISYLSLCNHPKPEHVIGGGDGGTVREVLKHPDVKTVTLVEIDDRVIEVCKQYLPGLSLNLNNPKVNISIGDGFKYLRDHLGEFDVIITDSSDPKTNLAEPIRIFSDEELNRMSMSYYNDKVHRAAFILPRFVEKAFARCL